jgi:hypothetical protein
MRTSNCEIIGRIGRGWGNGCRIAQCQKQSPRNDELGKSHSNGCSRYLRKEKSLGWKPIYLQKFEDVCVCVLRLWIKFALEIDNHSIIINKFIILSLVSTRARPVRWLQAPICRLVIRVCELQRPIHDSHPSNVTLQWLKIEQHRSNKLFQVNEDWVVGSLNFFDVHNFKDINFKNEQRAQAKCVIDDLFMQDSSLGSLDVPSAGTLILLCLGSP